MIASKTMFASILAGYLAVGFISWDWGLAGWSEMERLAMIYLAGVFSLGFFFYFMENKK
jgi:hypothetical protein